jgi:hypothetical protein
MKSNVSTRSAESRRMFIGGSDAHIIMGQNERALIRLSQEKRGEIGPEDLSGDLVAECESFANPDQAAQMGLRWSGLLSPSEPNAGAPTVFLYELDAGCLNRFLELCTRLIRDVRPESSFQALNGRDRQTSSQGEFALRPS